MLTKQGHAAALSNGGSYMLRSRTVSQVPYAGAIRSLQHCTCSALQLQMAAWVACADAFRILRHMHANGIERVSARQQDGESSWMWAS